MAGIVAGFHEGSRAEYLAQYLFSGFGTCIPVPHQEDSGIDLYCTMTENLGSLAWPRAYFTVQVKSADAPWQFKGRESVRWLVEQPLPLYICIVDKGTLRFRLYHTFARFHVWSLALDSLEYLELAPGPSGDGKCTEWDGGRQISLSAPILDVTLPELLEPRRVAEVRAVLNYWLDLDIANLSRITTGAQNFVMPQIYETNSIERLDRTASRTFGKRHVNFTPEEIRTSFLKLRPALISLARAQLETGDSVGAALTAMLMRYRDSEPFDFFDVAIRLSHMVAQTVATNASPDDLHRVVDELIDGVRTRIESTRDRVDERKKT